MSVPTGSSLQITTEALVKPGLAIEEREASRIRRLGQPPQDSGPLQVFVELFDPIDVLLAQRVSEGDHDDIAAAHETETLYTALYAEQEHAAAQAGLDRCSANVISVALGAP